MILSWSTVLYMLDSAWMHLVLLVLYEALKVIGLPVFLRNAISRTHNFLEFLVPKAIKGRISLVPYILNNLCK